MTAARIKHAFAAVADADPELAVLLEQETRRQSTTIDLIPSENYASPAVLEATASVLSAKYAEGYPGKRYYQGNAVIDEIENLVRERAKAIFGVEHVNAQALSGANANHAVYLALCQPGDATMGIEIPSGGHLSHGARVTFVARYYNPTLYQVDQQTERVDYDAFEALAAERRPRVIFVGASSYPRHFDYARLGEIARNVGAYLVADVAHVAGLIAGGVHPTPVPHADVVTTTTHKTLRGPRGALIMCREELAAQIDRAVFPGLQGGPFAQQIAGVAVALKEAQTPAFAQYAEQVLRNAKALERGLLAESLQLVTGGTDVHMVVVKLTAFDPPIASKTVADALEAAGLVVNRNPIPYDPNPPMHPSGIRFGTPAATTCGMGEAEMAQIAAWTGEVFRAIDDEALHRRIAGEVAELRSSFPLPGHS
jgi:glycine hydroxymethyltransferase